MELARNNHTIPQDYLRQWSMDGRCVFARRLLVPAPTYPEWEPKPISSLTVYRDLYTSVGRGEESDAIERWLNREFETPAADALDRVFRDVALEAEDHRVLVRYLAALDRRTPVAFAETMELLARITPDALSRAHARLGGTLRQAKSVRRRLLRQQRASTEASDIVPLPIRTAVDTDPETGDPVVKTVTTVGREAWLSALERQLKTTAQHLLAHDWCILRPANESEWFTSDHPVVRLNFTNSEQYDFRGGWGRRGTDIFLALSPKHLLYCRIGYPKPREQTASVEHTYLIQRCIAERAHRWIFARSPQRRAEWFRERRVNKALFVEEEAAWADFHDSQVREELSAP